MQLLTKRLVAPTNYTVLDAVGTIEVDTSSGGVTNIFLPPINFNYPRSPLFINDVSDNASLGNIIINTVAGNTINNTNSLVLDTNGIGALIVISDKTRFIANLNIDDQINPSGSDKNFVYTQNFLSSTWVVNHMLGKYCAVSVVDFSGNQIFCKVDYTSINTVVLNFNQPYIGRAFFN